MDTGGSGGNTPKNSSESSSSSNRMATEGRYLARLRKLEDDNYKLRAQVEELYEWKKRMEEWIRDQLEVQFTQEEETKTEDKVKIIGLVGSGSKTNGAATPLPATDSKMLLNYAVKIKISNSNGPGRRQAEPVAPSHVAPTNGTDDSSSSSSPSPSTSPVPPKKRKTEREAIIPSPIFDAKHEPNQPTTTEPTPIPTFSQNGSETAQSSSASNPGSPITTDGTGLTNGVSGSSSNADKPGPKSKKKSTNNPNNIDEEARCSVCDDKYAEENNEMLFCDKCNICVHQACYGVKEIPDAEWFCKPCAKGLEEAPKCMFCPNQGGAMVPVRSPSNKSWAHVFCAMWIPEVTFLNPDDIDLVINVNKIDRSRWLLKCSLCKKGKDHGACIQCQWKKCTAAFHVTCASRNKLKMEGVLDDALPGGVALMAWCQRHRNMTEG